MKILNLYKEDIDSPALQKVGKNGQLFTTPAQYFENLPAEVLNKVQAQPLAVVKDLKVYRFPLTAIAASILMVIGLHFVNLPAQQGSAISYDELVLMQVDEAALSDIVQISNSQNLEEDYLLDNNLETEQLIDL